MNIIMTMPTVIIITIDAMRKDLAIHIHSTIKPMTHRQST